MDITTNGRSSSSAKDREATDMACESVDMDTESIEIECADEPKPFKVTRRRGVCSEPAPKAHVRDPYWNKHKKWESQIFAAIKQCYIFTGFTDDELWKFVWGSEIHLRFADECFGMQGDLTDGLLIILDGTLNMMREPKDPNGKPTYLQSIGRDTVVEATSVLWSTKRTNSLYAKDQCTIAKLKRVDYIHLTFRMEFYRREYRQFLLRGVKLLEMMEDEQIAKLADVLTVKTHEPDSPIITQGDAGHCFYIMVSGESKVWVKSGNDIQEYRRYHVGDLFGELALLKNAPRAANVTAVTRCELLCLHRGQFERLLGPMENLHQQQYLTDPRKLISDFYSTGDSRGPSGSLQIRGLEPDPSLAESQWFAIYRPTSRDAIAKMLSGAAVGKGLNVKGKSAKQGVLSGLVPFMQISDNKHKSMIEKSPPDAVTTIYFHNKAAMEEARKAMENVLKDCGNDLQVDKRTLEVVEDYVPNAYGLLVAEGLVREAYIMRPDISPWVGWETGRKSEPAFMDMNLHAIRNASEPKVVLMQHDKSDPMNSRGLLIAYAEKLCKPVVSDFDTFTIASKGMDYESLPDDQCDLVTWALDNTKGVLMSLNAHPWTSRWLEVLKRENERGFHPPLPKYGFGDPTSYQLIGHVVEVTAPCGAIRHGAECSNFYFPQELDDEYLVVWSGFPDKPWEYKTEGKVREFLFEQAKAGFMFPLNPVWPVRDIGWYEVLAALRQNPDAQHALNSWYPPSSGILHQIEELHAEFPEGFKTVNVDSIQ